MFNSNTFNDLKANHPIIWNLIRLVALGFIFVCGFLGTLVVMAFASTNLGQLIGSVFNWLFAANTVQSFWYVTRAAGIISYLLVWLSTAWGLAVASKIFDRLLHRAITFDYHQFISLLAVGFIFLHVSVLMLDKYLPFSLAQVLIPFIDPYRPAWTGVGIIAFYLTLLVTVTFYLRKRIGMKAFQSIHLLSLVAFFGAAVHGLMAGTDSALLATRWMYVTTLLSVVFLMSYWLLVGRNQPSARAQAARLNQVQSGKEHPAGKQLPAGSQAPVRNQSTVRRVE